MDEDDGGRLLREEVETRVVNICGQGDNDTNKSQLLLLF